MPSDPTPELGVSGRFWIGKHKTMKNFDMVIKTLKSAKSEIRITTYSLGRKLDNELDKIFRILIDKSNSGVPVQIIVNRLEAQLKGERNKPVREKMKILKSMPDATVLSFRLSDTRDHSDLHAKIFTVDGETAILGSANLSFSGMFDNHEIMVKINGKKFVAQINQLIDELAENILAQDKRRKKRGGA